jgi:hypothetical protein
MDFKVVYLFFFFFFSFLFILGVYCIDNFSLIIYYKNMFFSLGFLRSLTNNKVIYLIAAFFFKQAKDIGVDETEERQEQQRHTKVKTNI